VDVDVEALQKRLGVKFKRPELLAQAMVHRSYVNEAPDRSIQSNERLDDRYPQVDEGRLTELRAHLVKGETLARVAERLGLGRFLLLGRGEDATGGRTRPLNLARTFEAVVGAMYLDAGFARTERWLLRVMRPELESLGRGELPADAKSRLQHRVQTLFGVAPQYRIVEAVGPDHAKMFTVEAVVGDRALGSGRGRSKRIAERQAAEEALARLDRDYGPAP